MSPYTYCANNPICFIDPDGMEADWVEKGDGTIYYDENATSQETTKEGETYKGKQGYDLENSYNPDGTITKFTGFQLRGVNVSPNDGDVVARSVSNAINENGSTVMKGIGIATVGVIAAAEVGTCAAIGFSTELVGAKMTISAGSQYMTNDGTIDLVDVLADGFLPPGAGSIISGSFDVNITTNNLSDSNIKGLGGWKRLFRCFNRYGYELFIW